MILAANANPLRRLGAMLYDALLCTAMLMIATLPFLPFIQNGNRLQGPALYAHRVWLLSVWIAFFGYFWTRKGRTLGMQAWRLRIETSRGELPTWRDALARLALAAVPWLPAYVALSVAATFSLDTVRSVGLMLFALVPLNYLMAWFDPKRRAWHDRFLGTKIVAA